MSSMNNLPKYQKKTVRVYYRMDALESAISEKDAHLAYLEMNGIRNAKQADLAEKLQVDKRRLMERLKKEVSL